MKHRRLRMWSGSERPLGFRRMARLRAWLQWAIAETCAMRHATNIIRRILEGDTFWDVDDGATRPLIVYRAHRHAYLPARFRAREKLA